MKRLILFLIIILLVTSCGGVDQTVPLDESDMPSNFTLLGKTETYEYIYRITDGDVVCYLASDSNGVDIECLP